MSEPTATILVTGDVFVDWSIVDPTPTSDGHLDLPWLVNAERGVHAAAMPGGAARSAALIAAAAARRPSVRPAATVVGPVIPPEALSSPFDGRGARSFSLVKRFPRSLTDMSGTAWRISRVWGLQPCAAADPLLPELDDEPVDLLAIQDIGIAYRRAPQAWYHPSRPLPHRIIVSTIAPLADNPLLDDLKERAADRLTVIVSSADLRASGARIGYPLSWERTAEEVDAAVRSHPIGGAACVIVPLELSGAVIVRRDGPTTLVFDPLSAEGSWQRQHPGEMVGHTLVHAAALACIGATASDDEVADAVRRGVAATRVLQREGLVQTQDPAGPALIYPTDAIAAALAAEPTGFIAVHHPRPDGQSIVGSTLGQSSMVLTAERLALDGPASLPSSVPVETVGAWSSVDRTEIETLRSVGLVIDEYATRYLAARPLGRPLSVAVFGTPGSGKSFAVRETIRHRIAGDVVVLEFNLSQFDSPGDLTEAFQQVRDAVLQQRLPLVFWDEFDTPLGNQRLGWLRHFLAPMQDGMFHEGDSFRPLGSAIFVFAGGTASSFTEFVAVSDADAERAAKKPDFVSRLRGYVDILGPNRRSTNDDAVVLRRALLLRSMLLRKVPQIASGKGPAANLRIDAGLLRAFLLVGEYKHGARSMEAIIDMSAVTGRLQYEQGSLPAPHLLQLHVDADEFLALAAG